jgi:acyl-CoA carboxylase subunit beta
VEAVTGAPVGPDSHHGRSAYASGLVDGLAAPDVARARLTEWVELLHPARRDGPLPTVARTEASTVRLEALDVVARTRAAGRPSARRLLATVFDRAVELSGDRAGGADPVAVAAVARLGARTVVVIGFDRDATGLPRPAAACPGRPPSGPCSAHSRSRSRHDLPVVSLIDTNGADPSPASEAGGCRWRRSPRRSSRSSSVDVADRRRSSSGEGGSGGALVARCDGPAAHPGRRVLQRHLARGCGDDPAS